MSVPTQPERQVTVTRRQANQALQDTVPVPALVVLAIGFIPLAAYFWRVFNTDLTSTEQAYQLAFEGIVLAVVLLVVELFLLVLNIGARRRVSRLFKPGSTIGVSETADALHLFTAKGLVTFPWSTTKGRLTQHSLRLTPAGGKRVAIPRGILTTATTRRFQ